MILSDRYCYSEPFQHKCASLLDNAFENVPFYAEWKKYDPGNAASTDERFDALPALTKSDMRAHFPAGLVPIGKDISSGLFREEIEYTFTSGTTSEKVVNIWNQEWWSRSEAASWKLNRNLASLSYPQRQAKLASSLNVGINCEEDLPMTHRILGDTLYLNEKTSILQWQPRHYKRMADELNFFKPAILEANPSLLARLSYWAFDNGKELYSPKIIVFTFEFPSAIHLSAIKKIFSSVFVSSYGSTETGFVLEQCEDGLMHQNTEFCRIDFQPLKPQYGGPELGRIFVSTFDNPWNCIIRFDVGDLIRLHNAGSCSCRRTEGLIADAVEGRTSNCTFTTNGGLVTTKNLDDVLSSSGLLRDYHFEQSSNKHYLLQAMPSPGNKRKTAVEDLHSILENLYGSGGVYDIQFTDNLLPGPAGKFRRTQTNFNYEERGLFQ